MLESKEDSYIEDEFFIGFVKPYKDEKYAFMALLPKKKSKSFLLRALKQIDFTGLFEGASYDTVYVTMRQFKYDFGEELTELFAVLEQCWAAETAYPSCQKEWVQSDPSYGQCAITATLVYDMFGGTVHKIKVDGGGTHYFNRLNGRYVDLTREQFDLYNIPVSYVPNQEIPREYIIKNTESEIGDVRDRMAGVGSINYDGMPHAHNPQAGEDRMIKGIEEIDALKECYRQAVEYMEWFRPAWQELPEDEQYVLETFYLTDGRQIGAVYDICDYFHIERSSAYNKKNRVLEHLTTLLFGKT